MLVEINFDGIIGPTHNYAGLSPGNLAAARSRGQVSRPKAAALQGLAKMRSNLDLGLPQGILLPHARPDHRWLSSLNTRYAEAAPHLRAQAMSASAMWAANAATVSPAPDTADGRCHLTVANLVTLPHRSHEWPETLAQLRLAFSDEAFRVHPPVPPPFGDEGAANHMRLFSDPGAPGIEIFVFGMPGIRFPARQHRDACEAIARSHGLDPDRTFFAEQSPDAIQAGAFHNDVVAVGNGRVLFAHEQAFADRETLYARLRQAMPELEIVEVPASRVSLGEAIASYLFNAQLVTLPAGEMMLIVPEEARDTPAVWQWLQEHLAGNGPIRSIRTVDVRESMANGGGPACLRLRVLADPATVDQRFLMTPGKLDALADVISRYWPDAIDPSDLAAPNLVAEVEEARRRLLTAAGTVELIDR